MMLLLINHEYCLWIKVNTEHGPDGSMEEANLEVKEHLLHVVGFHLRLLNHCLQHGHHGHGHIQGDGLGHGHDHDTVK